MRSSGRCSPAIVADGQQRLKHTVAYQRAVAEIEREVLFLYAPLLRRAGPMRRLVLIYQRRREILRRGSHLAPLEALYAVTDSSIGRMSSCL